MTIKRTYRDTKTVDPETGVWPEITEQAATIDDLIAELQAIRAEHGNLELVKVENDYEVGRWTSVIWKSDVDELTGAVHRDPYIDDLSGGTMDDQTFKPGQPIPGKYLFI